MSKRKPAMASKHHSLRTAAKVQRTAQDIKSPKDTVPRSVDVGSLEPPTGRHANPEQDDLVEHPELLVEDPEPFVEEPELLVENAETALQDAKPITDNNSKQEIDFSPANASVWAYQAKLVEMAQANMQLAFEFAQRFAAIRSPVELPSIIVDFTSKRIDMFRKHSKALAELSTLR